MKNKKILCLMVRTVGSRSQTLTAKSFRQIQMSNGTVVGKLGVFFSTQGPNDLWLDAVSSHAFLIELNSNNADMLQSYSIEKLK